MPHPVRVVLMYDEIASPSPLDEILMQLPTVTLAGSITHPPHLLAYVQATQAELIIVETDQVSIAMMWQLGQVHLHHPTVLSLVCLTNPVSHDIWGLLNARVTGYVHRDDIPDGLWNAIESIQHGAIWYSPSMVPLIQAWSHMQQGPHIMMPNPYELAIITCVAQGQTNRQIAKALSVNERTIRSQLEQLYRRWGVDNRTQAAIFAQEQGWIDEKTQERSWVW
ncbi:MAG: response regulator transcription factor [Chloroflexota bacterium]